MNRGDVQRCWTSPDDPWTPWVKTILFSSFYSNATIAPEFEIMSSRPLRAPPLWLERGVIEPLAAHKPTAASYRADNRIRDTAIIIDRPGPTGARIGVALAQLGFRPVPLYSATPSRVGIINMQPIFEVLVDGAERVARIPSGSPPAFLLDARRMGENRDVVNGLVDNRSICEKDDFPSTEALAQAGIVRAVLIADAIEPDLEPILFHWQSSGIALWLKRTTDELAAPFVLERRSWLRRIRDAIRHPILRRQRR